VVTRRCQRGHQKVPKCNQKVPKGLSAGTKGVIRRYQRGYQKVPKGNQKVPKGN